MCVDTRARSESGGIEMIGRRIEREIERELERDRDKRERVNWERMNQDLIERE